MLVQPNQFAAEALYDLTAGMVETQVKLEIPMETQAENAGEDVLTVLDSGSEVGEDAGIKADAFGRSPGQSDSKKHRLDEHTEPSVAAPSFEMATGPPADEPSASPCQNIRNPNKRSQLAAQVYDDDMLLSELLPSASSGASRDARVSGEPGNASTSGVSSAKLTTRAARNADSSNADAIAFSSPSSIYNLSTIWLGDIAVVRRSDKDKVPWLAYISFSLVTFSSYFF